MMKPKVSLIHFSSRRKTNVVTFSFSKMILSMVSNEKVFHRGNLLIGPKIPCVDPPGSALFGNVNTGSW